MSIGALLLLVLAGALLSNAIPHLASGLRGEAFPTPFAKPRGIGLSSPETNALWGTANLFAGVAIVTHFPGALSDTGGRVALAFGFVVLAVAMARHFGKVRKGQ